MDAPIVAVAPVFILGYTGLVGGPLGPCFCEPGLGSLLGRLRLVLGGARQPSIERPRAARNVRCRTHGRPRCIRL